MCKYLHLAYCYSRNANYVARGFASAARRAYLCNENKVINLKNVTGVFSDFENDDSSCAPIS